MGVGFWQGASTLKRIQEFRAQGFLAFGLRVLGLALRAFQGVKCCLFSSVFVVLGFGFGILRNSLLLLFL